MKPDPGRTLNALGDPTRRTILQVLRAGPTPVGEVAQHFDISRPAVSQHLRVLKDAGLVTDLKVANRRLYQLNPAAFETLRAYLDEFWSVALDNFQQHVAARSAGRKRSA